MNNQNMIDTVTRISGVNPRKCMRPIRKCQTFLMTTLQSRCGDTENPQRNARRRRMRTNMKAPVRCL